MVRIIFQHPFDSFELSKLNLQLDYTLNHMLFPLRGDLYELNSIHFATIRRLKPTAFLSVTAIFKRICSRDHVLVTPAGTWQILKVREFFS